MQSVVRAASLGQLARASASVVPSAVTSVKDTPLPSAAPPLVQAPATPLTSHSMGKQLLTGSQVRLSSGLGGEWHSYTLAIILHCHSCFSLQPSEVLPCW